MNWILDKIKSLFAQKYIASTTRTLVAALSGYLITKGLDQKQVEAFGQTLEPIATGIGMLAVTQVASWLDKKKNQS